MVAAIQIEEDYEEEDENTIIIGEYDTEIEAAMAYDQFVIENHLDNEPINFPSCRLRPLNWID